MHNSHDFVAASAARATGAGPGQAITALWRRCSVANAVARRELAATSKRSRGTEREIRELPQSTVFRFNGKEQRSVTAAGRQPRLPDRWPQGADAHQVGTAEAPSVQEHWAVGIYASRLYSCKLGLDRAIARLAYVVRCRLTARGARILSTM